MHALIPRTLRTPGGHTAEMLKLVESLDKTQYSPRMYVVANTDPMSGQKADAMERALLPKVRAGRKRAMRQWGSM